MNDKDFVGFIDETAEIAAETCSTKVELEQWIWKSWSTDDSRRRAAVGTFKQFRSHVLNVLDVNYPHVGF